MTNPTASIYANSVTRAGMHVYSSERGRFARSERDYIARHRRTERRDPEWRTWDGDLPLAFAIDGRTSHDDAFGPTEAHEPEARACDDLRRAVVVWDAADRIITNGELCRRHPSIGDEARVIRALMLARIRRLAP